MKAAGPSERGREFLLRTPMRRFGKGSNSRAAVFLSSDAASFVTVNPGGRWRVPRERREPISTVVLRISRGVRINVDTADNDAKSFLSTSWRDT